MDSRSLPSARGETASNRAAFNVSTFETTLPVRPVLAATSSTRLPRLSWRALTFAGSLTVDMSSFRGSMERLSRALCGSSTSARAIFSNRPPSAPAMEPLILFTWSTNSSIVSIGVGFTCDGLTATLPSGRVLPGTTGAGSSNLLGSTVLPGVTTSSPSSALPAWLISVSASFFAVGAEASSMMVRLMTMSSLTAALKSASSSLTCREAL